MGVDNRIWKADVKERMEQSGDDARALVREVRKTAIKALKKMVHVVSTQMWS
jgi:hypothetical protein